MRRAVWLSFVFTLILTLGWFTACLFAPPTGDPPAVAEASVSSITEENLAKLYDYAVKNGVPRHTQRGWMIALMHVEPHMWHIPAWPDRREYIIWYVSDDANIYTMRFVYEQHRRDFLLRDRIDMQVVSVTGGDMGYERGFFVERNLVGRREVLDAVGAPMDKARALDVMRAVLSEFLGEAGIK